MNIGIVGLGLIGGSTAKAIKKRAPHRVLGFDISRPVIERALKTGAIDGELTRDALGALDILVLALYPKRCVEYARDAAPYLPSGALVTDFCGVKRAVTRELEPLAREYGFDYIGAHPMAGREKSGFDAAGPDLFVGASLIVTPGQGAREQALERLKALSRDMGFAGVTLSTSEEHDHIIAYTSQLAHVLSSAYVKAPSALRHRGFSAGSFRDMTRVAYLNEEMWTELFLDNADYLADEVSSLAGRLNAYAQAIRTGDREGLYELLREGRIRKMEVGGE